MEYVLYGSVITNRLIYTDKTCVSDVMGGGGFYAYAGLRMCTPQCLFVAGVGDDFEDFYGEWFDRNGCSKAGLSRPLEKTIYNELVYADDGSYVEYSIYGPEYEKETFPKIDLPAEAIAPFLTDDVKGLFINSKMGEDIVELLAQAKQRHPFQVMWEVPASCVSVLASVYAQGGMDALRGYLKVVDIFSANRLESFEIFGVDTVEAAIEKFKELGLPVYYRVGSKGAYMIEGEECVYVPMISLVPREKEIDPTGCGNSSTAAAMWAYCEGFDLLKTCIVGNVAAAYNVQQYGPYPDMREDTHKEMMEHVERIYRELK